MENLPQQLIDLIYIDYVNKFELDKKCKYVLKLKNNNYIIKQIDKQIKKQIGDNIDLRWIIQNNYFNVIKWVLEKHPNVLDIKLIDQVVDLSSMNGRLNFLKLFWKKRNKIPFNYNIKTVAYACQSGHLNIVKWFWNKRNEIPFQYTESAVSWASCSGHLNIII